MPSLASFSSSSNVQSVESNPAADATSTPRTPSFGRIPADAIRSGRLARISKASQGLYAILCSCCNREWKAWPSVERLAEWHGSSLRSVYRRLAELRRAGLIVQASGGGSGLTSVYRIVTTFTAEAGSGNGDRPVRVSATETVTPRGKETVTGLTEERPETVTPRGNRTEGIEQSNTTTTAAVVGGGGDEDQRISQTQELSDIMLAAGIGSSAAACLAEDLVRFPKAADRVRKLLAANKADGYGIGLAIRRLHDLPAMLRAEASEAERLAAAKAAADIRSGQTVWDFRDLDAVLARIRRSESLITETLQTFHDEVEEVRGSILNGRISETAAAACQTEPRILDLFVACEIRNRHGLAAAATR